MKRFALTLVLSLAACAPASSACDSGGGGTTTTSTGGEGGAPTTSSEPACGNGLAFDPSTDPAFHLGGVTTPLLSGTLLAARFEPFPTATLAAPLVFVRVDEDAGCELPTEVLSAAWTEPDPTPSTDPIVTQSLISDDMIKPTGDPSVFRIRLDPVAYASPEPFAEYAYHAVVIIPHFCPALYAPSCDPSNGFIQTLNGWSALSTLTDASPGLGLYTDP